MTEQPMKEEPNHEIDESKKKCDEYLNNWKRAAADLINYKKEEMERMAKLMQYGKEDMIEKILLIFDTIYLSEKEIPQELKESEWMKGFLQIKSQINDFLKKEGIEEIKTVGEKFDPNTMEIVEAVEQGESGMVIEEFQKGYKTLAGVLRPAKVKVSK